MRLSRVFFLVFVLGYVWCGGIDARADSLDYNLQCRRTIKPNPQPELSVAGDVTLRLHCAGRAPQNAWNPNHFYLPEEPCTFSSSSNCPTEEPDHCESPGDFKISVGGHTILFRDGQSKQPLFLDGIDCFRANKTAPVHCSLRHYSSYYATPYDGGFLADGFDHMRTLEAVIFEYDKPVNVRFDIEDQESIDLSAHGVPKFWVASRLICDATYILRR